MTLGRFRCRLEPVGACGLLARTADELTQLICSSCGSLFDQYSEKIDPQHFYNVLLLAAIVQTIAVDTSICERGFSLMNNLKTVRRSSMGKTLLRLLMTICSLGDEWKDPTKIPVKDIIEEWRAQSGRGRYEGAEWGAEAMVQLFHGGGGGSGGGGTGGSGGSGGCGGSGGRGGGADEDDGDATIDSAAAGGLFGWLGRDAQPRRGEHAGVHLGNRTMGGGAH